MLLRDILPDEARYDPAWGTLAIRGMTADSRAVKAGFLFAAVPGTKTDGLGFLHQAVAGGAVAIMSERDPGPLPEGVAAVHVDHVRRALALTSAKFYPRQPATIAAVTGTSGKTSVAAFTRQIWTALGHRAASVGTIGIATPEGEVYGSLTTPDPVGLHRTLDRLAGEGVTHLALEASSHGLDQHRLDGVRVNIASFTNLSRDHLDYHPTLEDYFRAKLILFERVLSPTGTVVLDPDLKQAADILAVAARRGQGVVSIGRHGETIRLVDCAIDGFSQTLRLEHGGKAYRVRLPLVGAFQVENALTAAGHALASGGEPDAVFAALEGLEGAKGRLELVGHRNGAPIFVDYAHKPDALAKALEALRPYAKRQLAVVFGCGGDRDHGKRPLMGEIATRLADSVIVTDDNPRSEYPAMIRDEILKGAPGAAEIGDRRDAIRYAISELKPDDVLLVAGKGHETGQIVGDQILPFSDHEAVATALKEIAA